MFTALFWKQAAERAIKTFAQTLVATGVVVGVAGWDKWQEALIASAIAAALSVITSVASISLGDKGTPSLVPAPSDPALAPEYGVYLEPEIPHPGENFDTTNFGPPVIDPASMKDV